MFRWLKKFTRKKLVGEPFPAEWESYLKGNVSHYLLLSERDKGDLQNLVKVFVAEKNWEGCGGLELDDEIKVTISALACLLLLGIPHDYYRNVESILVYPSTVVTPERTLGIFERPHGPADPSTPILGQAFLRGPLILVWDSVLRGARHPESGHNVVYHEFAHKLDMLDGMADGTPPLRKSEEYQKWVEVCSREFLTLKKRAKAGKKTFLDRYGATNEAEFFAVATEEFFNHPLSMRRESPELYRVLKEYYRQDTASRQENGAR